MELSDTQALSKTIGIVCQDINAILRNAGSKIKFQDGCINLK